MGWTVIEQAVNAEIVKHLIGRGKPRGTAKREVEDMKAVEVIGRLKK